MPRDTAWIEEVVAPADLQSDTALLRQMDMTEIGLDIPHVEPDTPRFETSMRLHVLLGLACDDFAKVLLDLRYGIDVGRCFHIPARWRHAAYTWPLRRTTVCVAGAVAAKRFYIRSDIALGDDGLEDEFGPDIAARLDAVNALRCGGIDEALEVTGNGEISRRPDIIAMTERWTNTLHGVCDASNRVTGFLLLWRLRRLHTELKEANL